MAPLTPHRGDTRLVTVIVDASYRRGRAGWAGWIRTADRPPLSPGGSFRARDSGWAECFGAARCIDLCLDEVGLTRGDRILLQCDNQEVGAHIAGRSTRVQPLVAAVARAHTAGVLLTPRHVKGHTAHATARHGSQRACDARAWAFMRACP